MNKTILAGNITQDPTIKVTQTGTKVASTSIATNEFYKDANGERQQATEYHNLVAFGKTAELFENYITKWAKLLIEWKLKTRSWDAEDWSKRYKTEVHIEKLEFMWGSKKENITQNDVEDVFGWDQPF